MKNTEYGESGQMPPQQEIEFHPPPAYSFDNAAISYNPHNSNFSAVQTVVPNWVQNNSSVSIGSNLNNFNQTLGNNESFLLSPNGRVGFTTRTLIVQIRDTAQRPLISVMTIPGRNVTTGSDNQGSVHVGSVIQMTNTSGQTLLTATENGQSITVSSGDQILGVVEGHLMWSTSLTVRGIMGEILFQSIGGTEINTIGSGGCCGSTPSQFTLISNGVAFARIENSTNNSNECTISLINSQNYDVRTKALLVFSGYLIYYAFLANTSFGKIGARGFAKRICLYICIFFLVVMVLFISIPIIVITTR